MPPFDPSTSTLTQWIGSRALRHGSRIAVTFLDEDDQENSWTYRELWQRSCELAARLSQVDSRVASSGGADSPAPRALLLFPPGIEFVAGFLGCQIAGWTPVPISYPRAGRANARLDSTANDCQPAALVGDRASIEGLVDDHLCDSARSLPRVMTCVERAPRESDWVDPESLPSDLQTLALLQYTSGSTSEPKGVMVRQSNLMANLEAIRRGFEINWQADDVEQPECSVSWLPAFHDMGLIGGILGSLYVGGRTILLSPQSFLRRPVRWLQAISDYGAVVSGAPNFAYQLCVDRIAPEQVDSIDLRGWRVAFSGAEPVSSRTLHDFSNRFFSSGFTATSFQPCYGLAEASLLGACNQGSQVPTVITVERESLRNGKPTVVAEGRGHRFQTLVSCGRPAYETELLIVDPHLHQTVGPEVVGEVWLRGTSITDGYWNRDDDNLSQFNAKLRGETLGGEASADRDEGKSERYCRTGDLGFLFQDNLYVTGRLKDLIIIGGRNLFPQDIESTVRQTIGREAGQCVAFAASGIRGEALAIVAELPRRADESSLPELARSVRRSVIEEHEVDPRHLLLVRQATIPMTSSGKVQRHQCRERLSAGEFQAKYRFDRASASVQTPIPIPNLPSSPLLHDRESMLTDVEAWMSAWLVARAGVAPAEVDLAKPFAEYGLDSMTAVEMSGEIEDWSGVGLSPAVAEQHPTPARLSGFIVEQLIQVDRSEVTTTTETASPRLAL